MVTKRGLSELETREGLLSGLKNHFTLKTSPPYPSFLTGESVNSDQALVTFRYRGDFSGTGIKVLLKWENGTWKVDSF